ncbi:MAG: glycosyltransferase family 4 protein [Bacteroidales bacterium]|nr:glycosyltransferase family 4 protein [Bacteroidales bacterium]
MNIGFDAKRLYNNFTGLGNHSRTTIDILTGYYPENTYYLYTPKIRPHNMMRAYLDKEHCKTIFPDKHINGSIWRTFGMTQDIKRDKIDIFHGLSNELPVGIDKCNIPSVVTIHDVAFKSFKNMYHWQDRQIYDMKWRYAIKHADRIIVISKFTKQELLRYYDVDESRIDIIYQPVNPSFYKDDCCLLSSEEANMQLSAYPDDFLLYVGSINSRKNLLGIIKAIELLPKDLQIPVVAVGDESSYKTEVLQYIAKHHLENLVIFPTHRIEDDELHLLYQKARAFVFPSFYEGFGLPVVEAQLKGCPVITSNTSGLVEAGGPFSLLCDPHNPEDISNKIQMALTDDVLRDKLIAGGKDFAMNNYHPHVLAERLMDIYNTLR